MDAFNLGHVEQIVFVKSARVGGTEAGNNMLGFAIDQEPGPILYVYPDENSAKEELKTRISRFIKSAPRLIRHAADRGWLTIDMVFLGRTTIFMAWASSATTLIRRTIRWIFIDEIDNCDQQAGKLGDTLELVSARVTTYKGRSKIVLTSTPSIPTASAWVQWLASDQRRYYVPCPECGTYQYLKFDHIKVDGRERDPDKIIAQDLAYYECEHCLSKLKYKTHQRWMVARGVWIGRTQLPEERLPVDDDAIVALAVFDHIDQWTPQLAGEPEVKRKIGFHIWSAYSPWRSWSEILAKWFEIKDKGAEERQVFKNQWLGEPWEEVQSSVNTERLRDKVLVGLPRLQVPELAQRITAAIDIQADRIYYAARAWGPYCESWLLDHGVVYSLSGGQDVFNLMSQIYKRYMHERPFFRGSLTKIRPDVMAIDSGYLATQVYRWVQDHVWTIAVKGESKLTPQLVRKSNTSPKQAKIVSDEMRELWLINADNAKDTLYSWANQRGSGPNTFHLHNEVDDDWINQFTAEHKVIRKGKVLWVVKTSGRDNHMLDLEVMMLGAAEVSQALTLQPIAQGTTEPSPPLPPRGLVR